MNNVTKISHDCCTGCGACYNKCPVNAIEMKYDSEGFIFPVIDTKKCIDCGACIKCCPVEKPTDVNTNPHTYAVMADEDTRMKSSSGGMFTMLARVIFDMGGVVCGARYSNDFQTVYHAWATNETELQPLRGSKYVQSETRQTYRETKEYLKKGIPVLYTGTPCQIAGLYNFLGKDHKKLYTADLVCHGSNSTTAYRSFLKEFTGGKEIECVNFRDKTFYGWSTPTVVYFKDGSVKKCAWNEGKWYEGFLNGIINRKACYQCPYANDRRVADITMADCWQVHRINPAFDDRKGTSLILVNSKKGESLFNESKKQMKLCEEIDLGFIRQFNGQLNHPTKEHRSRRFFFEHLKDGYHTALWYGNGRHYDVGIVGWWFASNYGSSLTYYSLASILEDMNKQILFVPIPKKDGTPWDPDSRQTVDFLSKRFHVGRKRDFCHMKEFNTFCDSFLLGSDQMWTPFATDMVGYTFFLDFVDLNKKKIAFSTSFGQSDFNVDEETRLTAKDFLDRFDAISVREHSGVDICKATFGLDVEQVLDPVFLCPKARYDELTKDVSHDVSEKYLLCYILDPSPEKEAAAKYIAEMKGLKIITILSMLDHHLMVEKWHTGEVLPKITTEEFVYYVKNCSYLMTDSHHGVCMGIIYEREYTALVNPFRGSTRFEAVANSLKLEDRLLYDPTQIAEAAHLNASIDYDQVKKNMEPEVERAYAWLDTSFAKETIPAKETINTINARCKALECDLNNMRRDCERRCAELQRKVDIALKSSEEIVKNLKS